MIVLRLEQSPISLRGDLTKWLLEIDSGVYVGNLSARVRDRLWKRVTENVKNGRAIMVYSTNNEQGLAFKVHGTMWEPIDFDGLKLMMRPSPSRLKEKQTGYKPGTSRQSVIRRAKYVKSEDVLNSQQSAKNNIPKEYAVIDVETTGLNDEKDEIIELGAIKVINSRITDELNILVKPQMPLPQKITELTGITQSKLNLEGIDMKEALPPIFKFCG